MHRMQFCIHTKCKYSNTKPPMPWIMCLLKATTILCATAAPNLKMIDWLNEWWLFVFVTFAFDAYKSFLFLMILVLSQPMVTLFVWTYCPVPHCIFSAYINISNMLLTCRTWCKFSCNNVLAFQETVVEIWAGTSLCVSIYLVELVLLFDAPDFK